ncbi:hypothetical protein BgAZ_106350 [Babesia gibsoni]|uniref:FUZ/MON1/HPS1 second Longin domain-containing protein n=1 Tax=Babesia gibsoni TaxID=33632 RepID=A0AAD8PG31_BABGI|nr:hypothetical protein BgAZ_106350 [Babesia gibsoni]
MSRAVQFSATASNILQQQESWTPLCLPDFNDQAFTYAYVNYIEPEIGVVCISRSGEQDQFHQIAGHLADLKSNMETSGCIDDLRLSLSATPLEFPSDESKSCEILHVLYLSKKHDQYLSSAYRQSVFGDCSSKILSAYKALSELIYSSSPRRSATACFEVRAWLYYNDYFAVP